MSSIEIVSKIEALKEWEALAAEAAAEIEALKDCIKREMDVRGVEEIEAGQCTSSTPSRAPAAAFRSPNEKPLVKAGKQ